jgi:DNA-binding MarR family transcriptional regulator
MAILGITKQSLGRILKDLAAKGLVSQSVGSADRRERRLALTTSGQALEQALTAPQRALMANAYRAAGAEAVAGFRTVLTGLRKR